MTAHAVALQENERASIIDRAVEAADRQGARDGVPDLHTYLTRYFRFMPVEAMRAREPVDLAGAALSHRMAAAARAQGTAIVRSFTPTVEQHGWSTGHTVIEIITDDMPFLVDSVISELNRLECGIHLIVHPQLVVRRTVTGELVEVLDSGPSEWHSGDSPHDSLVESWMHVEIDRQTHPARLEEISHELRRVLEDVRVAVEDWPLMMARVTEIMTELTTAPPVGIDPREVAEARTLLGWLAEGNFTFLGYREYHLSSATGPADDGQGADGQAADGNDGAAEGQGTEGHDADVLVAETGTGLGILRHDSTTSSGYDRLNADARARAREKTLLVVTKANSRATVHRSVYLDYIGIKTFDASGEVSGERRFLGLFASSAYTDSVRRIPLVNRKVSEVLARAGFGEETHSGKDLLQILETYPRDELFDISVDDLTTISRSVMDMQQRRRTRLFLRKDAYGRYISSLVYLPRDRYTTKVRLKIADVLRTAFDATSIDFTARVSESALARLHFVVRVSPGSKLPDVDAVDLEAKLVEATRAWDEDLSDALRSETGEEESARLYRTWGRAFPEAYKEDFDARVAVADLRRLEQLAAGVGAEDGAERALSMNLYQPVGCASDERRFKLYRLAPLSLTEVLPFLSNLGVEVVDERPYVLELGDGTSIGTTGKGADSTNGTNGTSGTLTGVRRGYIYDFGLRYGGPVPDPSISRDLFCEAFAAAWAGRAESDGFDRLVLLAGLSWRAVVVLRAYAKYLRQTGTTFSQDYIERCLRANVPITATLLELFRARFDPEAFADDEAGRSARDAECDRLAADLRNRLDGVASLDHDRILRSMLALIRATLRTNAYQRDPGDAFGDGHKDYVSFKFDPSAIPDLPAPRPAFEIFVYSPKVEGVHLRFGKVARGGLRWSDRPEDFRTEILGLVKAQTVKNAVIVPTGAKGGFVGKHLPDPGVDREAWLSAGIACYKLFISGLLDLTDNLVGGDVVPPPRVVRHDGDDTYLVVAADKGTATFSDIANGLAVEYGFWLGDAFASGGSVGYDHKAMGITAKGAWESVKRHFREMGRDVQTEEFTVVGIGDMSGDVFGNGMLLSPCIRLVAAFDHRHVFLDPTPDAAASFAERSRMFALPRSSWADYDTSLISPGGGVHPRSAKSITITPEVAGCLGLADGVESMTPAELIHAILQAPVDLLWNGGIGTYVKAADQSHAEVGDKTNDSIRINGNQLRCRVVGEGGNLGLTQLGRVEAAQNGVRVNTDAIDNSAGVDCSDHEVNIKILLDRIVAAGDLTGKQRNQLLAEMTEDVGRMVLRDNYEQNVLLGNARKQSHGMLVVHQRFMRSLEARGLLNRELEFLPDDAALALRAEQGRGLTSPEFSVLVAYSKITLTEDLMASDLPADPWFGRTLRDYFPPQLVTRYGDNLAEHPLRHELITTCLVNEMVNRGGITFAFRAEEETGASPQQVARAYTVCREIFELRSFVADVEALDNQVSTEAQTALYLAFRRLLDRSVRWFLQTRPGTIDVGAEIERFGPVVTELGPRMTDLAVGGERRQLREDAAEFVRMGIPEPMAVRGAGLLNEFQLLDITEISTQVDASPAEVAPVYTALSERYCVDAMLTRISQLPRADRWQSLARAALRYDLYAALESLTIAVLTASPNAPMPPEERINSWERANTAAVARATHTLEEVRRLEKGDLASLSVALRTLRGVVRSTG
ncbi:MAG: NAD-glutamate dehydrogenase [Kineosporiaceae bacterium]|nr:NAD-glutamate dehydrogenase [Kineosporiaceae bacterium]